MSAIEILDHMDAVEAGRTLHLREAEIHFRTHLEQRLEEVDDKEEISWIISWLSGYEENDPPNSWILERQVVAAIRKCNGVGALVKLKKKVGEVACGEYRGNLSLINCELKRLETNLGRCRQVWRQAKEGG